MYKFPDTGIVFDTEYTTWEGAQERDWKGPGEFREIIQIGALRVSGPNFLEKGQFLIHVKPKANPMLSEYCKALTGITQDTIDREGISFPKAIASFFQWSQHDTLHCYGKDSSVLKENCALHGIPFPFGDDRFVNIREIVRGYGVDDTKYMSSTLVEAFGGAITRRGHDALNDARTLVDAFRLFLK